MSSCEEFQKAGLYDPVLDADSTRLELLQWLEAKDFTIAEMLEAHLHPKLGLTALASDRRLQAGELLTRSEALESSGLSREEFDEYVTALSFGAVAGAPPGEIGFTSGDAAMLSSIGALVSMFSRGEALALVRVIGSSATRIAEASVALFLQDIEAPRLESGWNELSHAQQTYEAVGLLDGDMGTQLNSILRRHTMQAIERTRSTAMGSEERFDYRFAVGFVDLVGFTSISAKMSPQELGDFIREFEGRSHEAVTAEGARVVKLIGDEVMFVCTDPNAACRAASALMDGFESASDRVLPRGGLAYGNVLMRGGDYFGPVVNLASRLVGEATTQELLVTDPMAAAATECNFVQSGERLLKGFTDPVPVSSFLSA
jgi:adenylate cyclase